MSRVELCVFLLGRGADANIQDNQGRSALMLACESDSVETAEALLRGGADTQLVDALGHKASDYGVTTGNQRIMQMLRDGAPPAAEGRGEEIQGLLPSPKPRSPSSPARSPEPPSPSPSPSPQPRQTQQSAQAEDEEVFEEIRRLRLERGRLLQKIKALELQQQSALTALEELSQLKQRLKETEAERDKLLHELKGGHGIGASDSEDMDEMFDFPEKLLSKRSRAFPAQDEATSKGDSESANPSPVPGDPGTVAELRKHIEELASQNSELALKVQMLEMFEKDDTDMQSSSSDFVPVVQYETLRKEFEALQERQAAGEASNVAEDCIDGKSDEGGAGAESAEALREKLRGLEEQLATSRSELEELKEQMRLGVLSVECGEGDPAAAGAGAARGAPNQAAQQLSARVAELEEELAGRPAEAGGRSSRDGVTIKQLTEKVEELRAALSRRESTKGGGEKDGEGEKTVKALREE
uniref:Ankyrin repeat domain 24 n=1 Tax=Gasterosteus aculeatus aculeatus TaxID=481459 RepID=A0AAQ4QZZ5_GASAC